MSKKKEMWKDEVRVIMDGIELGWKDLRKMQLIMKISMDCIGMALSNAVSKDEVKAHERMSTVVRVAC